MPEATLESLIDSWSPSRTGCACRCIYLFFRRYVLGERKAPTISLAFGSSFDTTANHAYKVAKETEELPPVRDCQDCFVASWDENKYGVEDWEGKDAEDLEAIGLKATEVWHKELAQPIQPVGIQEPYLFGFKDEPWMMDGGPDLDYRLPGDPESVIRVLDNKTAGKKWNKGKMFREPLFPFYALGTQAKYGMQPEGGVRIHGVLKTKKGGTFDLAREVTIQEQQGLLHTITQLRGMITGCFRSGCFPPTGFFSGHFLCSRKYCGMWQDCEREFKIRIPD